MAPDPPRTALGLLLDADATEQARAEAAAAPGLDGEQRQVLALLLRLPPARRRELIEQYLRKRAGHVPEIARRLLELAARAWPDELKGVRLKYYTVPFDPDARGEEIKGRTISAVRKAAAIAVLEGHTVESLRRLPQFESWTLAGCLVRTAIRWGLVPCAAN